MKFLRSAWFIAYTAGAASAVTASLALLLITMNVADAEPAKAVKVDKAWQPPEFSTEREHMLATIEQLTYELSTERSRNTALQRQVDSLRNAPTYPLKKWFYPVKPTDPGYNAKTSRRLVKVVEPAYINFGDAYFFPNSDIAFKYVWRRGNEIGLLADGRWQQFTMGQTYGVDVGKTRRCHFTVTGRDGEGIHLEEACFS